MSIFKTLAEAALAPESEFVALLCEITGMNYCGEDCGCGDNAELMFWPVSGGEAPEWLPDWTNGVGYTEIYDWLQAASLTDSRIETAVRAALTPERP